MVSPTGAVYTLSKQYRTVRPVKGTGTMEITDNKIVLNTGSERIEIEPPVPSDIRNGTVVRYSLHEQTVHLSVMHPSEIQEMTDDIPVVDRQAVAFTSLPYKNVAPLTLDTPLPEGMYTFSNVEELTAFLKTEISVETLRQIEKIIASEGTVVLQITPAEDGNNYAYVLRPSELAYSLEKLRATFKSPLLTVIPPMVLKELLSGHGALPFAALRQIDDLLATAPHLFPHARSGSVEAQNKAIVQWLNTALDIPAPLDTVVRRAPVHSLGALLTDIENMRQGDPRTLHSILSGFPSLETFLAERPSQTRDWLQQIIEQLGFTFESDIRKTTTDKSPSLPETSLKKLLLQLSASELKSASSTTAGQLPAADNTQSHIPTKQTTTIPDAQRLREHLQVTKRSILTLLKQQLPEIYRQLLRADDSPIIPLPHKENTAAGHSVPTTDLSGPQTIKTVQTIFAFLKSGILSPLTEHPPMQDSTESDVSRVVNVLSSLRELTNKLDPRISSTGIPNQPQTGATGSESSPAADITPALSTATLIPLLRKSLDALDTLIMLLQQTERTTDTDRLENVNTSKTETGAEGKAEGLPVNSTFSDMPANVRNTFQSALEVFESLQLLARQTPVSQGTQQIITLPVNVNGQWTEVNIRVVREKKRKHRRATPHYSVVLSVAPEATGAITVHLDYQQKRPIKIAIDCERNRTRTWFLRHRDAIRQTLDTAGVSVGNFEFRKIHSPDKGNRAETGAGSDRNMIDMKV